MAKILIKRSSEYNNMLREIGLYIDGEKVGTINNGETQEYEVTNGKHEVFAKIDWCGSQKINLDSSDGKLITLSLSGFKFGKWIIPIMLIFSVTVLLLVYFFDVPFIYLFWVPVIPVLYPSYYITIGRNQCLVLSKTETAKY